AVRGGAARGAHGRSDGLGARHRRPTARPHQRPQARCQHRARSGRHRGASMIRSVPGRTPRIHPGAWVDPAAQVIGDVVIEEGAQVGAGALVPQGKVVPAGWLVMGVPAKPVRKMEPEEIEDIKRNAVEYFELWQRDYRFGPQGAPGSTPRAPNSPVPGKPPR